MKGVIEMASAVKRDGRAVVTTCGGCYADCAFAAHVKDGRVVAELPVPGHLCAARALCARGRHRLAMPFDERDRIVHPMRRRTDGSGFDVISWDEAFAQIAARLGGIVDGHGPRALGMTLGVPSFDRYWAYRFMHALGSPNVYGADGACEVSRLTGIYPDFYVMVEWEAIGELVDALGGVYFDVPFDMNYDDPYQDLHIHQEAGYRKLSGEDAMEVIRWRKNNGEPSPGDVGRIQIQQDFLSAVLDKCLQPATLLKAPALAQVFLNNVTTDLTVGNILAFAQLAIGMDPESDVKFSTMPYTGVMYDRASLVLPVEKELLEILNSGMNPYVDQIQSSDLQLMYKKSGGGYGVTTGTLLDSSMAYAGSSSSSSGTQTTQETEEPETEQPGETDAGTETPGTTPPEGTETGTGEPGSTGSETGEPGTQGPEGETPDTDDPGAVQPEGPGQGEGPGASQPEQDPGGGNGGASQSEPSQPGTEGESGGSDLPPEWLLPDVA